MAWLLADMREFRVRVYGLRVKVLGLGFLGFGVLLRVLMVNGLGLDLNYVLPKSAVNEHMQPL